MNPNVSQQIDYQPSDVPVMPTDRTMRVNHTSQSVNYNLGHLRDHAKGVNESIKKMATMHPALAKTTHQKAVMHATKVLGMIKKGAPNMKPSAGTVRPVLNNGTTRKTGTFQGKSNSLGGGGRFKQLTSSGMSPGLAAHIGRVKYGAKAMAKMAGAGRKG